MSEEFHKNLKDKGYSCKGYDCEINCLEHQIRNLSLKENELPDLNEKKRIGVIKKLAVSKKMIKETLIETFELGETTLNQYKRWNELTGTQDEFIVILRKSAKVIDKPEKLKELIVRFVPGNDEATNQYRKSVIIIGIKKLFELNKDKNFYWEWDVYFMLNNSSIGYSGGVALLLALYSAYYRISIPSNVAATGKIKNDGSTETVGGLREKTICALKNKVEILVLPEVDYNKGISLPFGYFEKLKKVHPIKSYKDLISLLFQWKEI